MDFGRDFPIGPAPTQSHKNVMECNRKGGLQQVSSYQTTKCLDHSLEISFEITTFPLVGARASTSTVNDPIVGGQLSVIRVVRKQNTQSLNVQPS